MLNAEEVKVAEDKQVESLVGRFFNDSYWFDQMACSSPRLVVWIGNKSSCDAAKELFWPRVAGEVTRRGLRVP